MVGWIQAIKDQWAAMKSDYWQELLDKQASQPGNVYC